MFRNILNIYIFLKIPTCTTRNTANTFNTPIHNFNAHFQSQHNFNTTHQHTPTHIPIFATCITAPRAEPLTPITAPQKPPVQSSIVNQKEKVPIVVQNGSSKKPVASNAQQHVVKPQNSRVSPVQQEQQLPVVAQPVSAAQQQPVQPVIRQQQQPPVNSQQAKSPQQQGMNFQQGMNSQQPVNSQQPMNFEQPMNSQQPVVQPMNSQQFEQKAVPVPISTQLDDFLMPPSLDDLISSDAAPAVVQQQHGQTADPLAGLLGENDDQNSQLLSFHEDSKNLAKQTRIMQLFNNSSSQAPVAQQDKKTTPVADDFF